MKIKNLIPLLGLISGSFLSAQFTTDFTAAEGYSDGLLSANADWSTASTVFNVSDSAGAGILLVGNANFAKATYVGPGATLTDNDYTSTVVFTLDYSGNTAANVTPGSAILLGRYEFGGGDLTGAALRQITTGPGQYNLNLFHNLGGTSNLYDGLITAEQLGLATDGTTWTDAVSDPIQLIHTMTYDGAQWTQTMTVSNLTTATVLGSVSRSFADAGTFLVSNNSFLLNTGGTNNAPGLTIDIDSVDVAAAPPPPPPDVFTVDFTAAEGYTDGTLNGNGGGAWTVPNPVVWNVTDSAGTGLLAITPNGTFQRVTYAGTGSALTTNAYSSSNVFILDYSADTLGANLAPAANTLLARFEFQGGGVTGSWLRQLGSAEVALPGQFGLYVYSDLNADNPQQGGIALESAALGLAHDGTNWTDAVSDPLEILHYMVHDAVAGTWTQISILTNLTTGTVLDTLEQTYAEDDNSFRDTTNSYVINNGRLLDLANLTFKIDSVTISTVAELPADIVITSALVNGSNEFVIDFMGAPSSNYEVKKSADLSGFNSLTIPLIQATDASGVGQAIVPASEMTGARQFFRLEDAP